MPPIRFDIMFIIAVWTAFSLSGLTRTPLNRTSLMKDIVELVVIIILMSAHSVIFLNKTPRAAWRMLLYCTLAELLLIFHNALVVLYGVRSHLLAGTCLAFSVVCVALWYKELRHHLENP